MIYPQDWMVHLWLIAFIVILVSTVLLGVFGGWKKMLFWGCGNIIFYIVAIIIYRFLGDKMAQAIAALVKKFWTAQEVTQEHIRKVAVALSGPVIFIVVFALGEIILAINYAAWYKRVVGIRKEKAAKKQAKACKKACKDLTLKTDKPKLERKLLKYKVTIDDLKKVQTTKYKVTNALAGGFGLLAFSMPTTLTFTQTVLCVTTCTSMRNRNPAAQKFYNFLYNLDKKIPWAAFYYSTNLLDILDAGTAAGKSLTEKITKFTIPLGKEKSSEDPKEIIFENQGGLIITSCTYIAYIEYLFGILGTLSQNEGIDEEHKELLVFNLERIYQGWNSVLEPANDVNMQAENVKQVFNNTEVLQLMVPIINEENAKAESKGEITHHTFSLTECEAVINDTYDHVNHVLEGLRNGTKFTIKNALDPSKTFEITLTPPKKMKVSSKCKDLIAQIACTLLKTSATEEIKAQFIQVVSNSIDIFFEFVD